MTPPQSDTQPATGLRLVADSDRGDTAAFLARAARIDDSGVLRLKQRGDGRVGLWVRTGFDILVSRSVFGSLDPGDVVADAGAMSASLQRGDDPVELGSALPAAWRGALPGSDGFAHLDDIPARELMMLARQGAHIAREESGPLGAAGSLLDQEVISVTADEVPGESGAIAMRAVFALTGMGFVRDARGHEISEDSPISAIAAEEPIRVRLSPSWIRLDARFGSVYQRRTAWGLSVR